MTKIFFNLLFPALLITGGIVHTASGQESANTQIKPRRNSVHIADLRGNTLTVVSGTTYRYTVDTPEGTGLVNTAPDVTQLLSEIAAKDGTLQQYRVTDKTGVIKKEGIIAGGDHLSVTSANGRSTQICQIVTRKMALPGSLWLDKDGITVGAKNKLTLYFKAGQRTPDATINIYLPSGVQADMAHTTVNVIGRGEVKLKDLATQSIGRAGTHYSYSTIGHVALTGIAGGGQKITFSHLDLRPDNGEDLKIVLQQVCLNHTGDYVFSANYIASQPEQLYSPGKGTEQVSLKVSRTIADFQRVPDKDLQYRESTDTYLRAKFQWAPVGSANAQLMQSTDKGKIWQISPAAVDLKSSGLMVSGLLPKRLYCFKLMVKSGVHKGSSNIAWFYSGKMDVKNDGVIADGKVDNTDKINAAIAHLNELGGGTLLFSQGVYSVRTIHLKSNVYLYLDHDATLQALKGGDDPETTWFCDKKYRSGLSPTDFGPYADPENYMTKQDVGHQYFHNAMFTGERLDNIKIIGSGRITGNGNLVNGDRVMNNTPENRGDKIFSLKLCTNIEIGGLSRKEDLWYDSTTDEPYYIGSGSAKLATDNMLNIDRSGHFVLLATGTDHLNIHDTYTGKQTVGNSRDIFDFMGCNNADVTNIYTKTTSDDIVKLGSDCSLGFTRPACNYKIRNIIGDTNCNLVQLGSETADDITDVYIDNIYVLGANKAGFSISANDGAHIKNVQLNSGYTGPVHSRSKMYRCTTPFFISISNRGRVIGADAGKYVFTEDGKKHNELLVKNVNIGLVEDVNINGVDVAEVYGGSSYSGKRWKAYDGTQRKATPVIAGYQLPEAADVEGGLDFKLPNGKHTGYVTNISLNDVNVLVKGGNPVTDTLNTPPEMGVGQYNVGDLKIQPSYGLWARHVKGLTVKNSTFNYEQRDGRYALFLDDVAGANITSVKAVLPAGNHVIIALKNASDINAADVTCFDDKWGMEPRKLPVVSGVSGKGLVDIPGKE